MCTRITIRNWIKAKLIKMGVEIFTRFGWAFSVQGFCYIPICLYKRFRLVFRRRFEWGSANRSRDPSFFRRLTPSAPCWWFRKGNISLNTLVIGTNGNQNSSQRVQVGFLQVLRDRSYLPHLFSWKLWDLKFIKIKIHINSGSINDYEHSFLPTTTSKSTKECCWFSARDSNKFLEMYSQDQQHRRTDRWLHFYSSLHHLD